MQLNLILSSAPPKIMAPGPDGRQLTKPFSTV